MTRVMKHNPAFLDDEALMASFRVRQTDLDLLLETLRENIDARANQHVLVMGPRGMGKTTLVRRVAVEVRRDEVLSRAWFPIVFGEESYAISNAGEFWLEAILHLADALGDASWRALYEALHREPDAQVLSARALARLTEFADARGVKLLLIVENLQMLLGEQLNSDAASSLRHTLQTEPRIMLLGTAASRFDAIEKPDQPMFELFRRQTLDPLSEDEARSLWNGIAERPLTGRRIRPVQILTGGNPRLLAILASFAAQRSFRELMTDLVHLVDEHTTYFKANVEALPAGERKVLVALADLWHRASARQVADQARLDAKTAGVYLKRLVDRGVVSEVDRIGRVRLYELTERLYNIYHLLRRRGGEQAQVKALVEFMVAFYERDELGDLASLIAREACGLGATGPRFHVWALGELVARSRDAEERTAWMARWPAELFELPDLPASLVEARGGAGVLEGSERNSLVLEAVRVLSGNREAASRLMRVSLRDPIDGVQPIRALLDHPLPDDWKLRIVRRVIRAAIRFAMEAIEEGFSELRQTIDERPEQAPPYYLYGVALMGWGESRAEAEEALEQAVDHDPRTAMYWLAWGRISEDPGVAEKCFRQVLDLEPRQAEAYGRLGMLLLDQTRLSEASECLERAVELDPKAPPLLVMLALALDMDEQWLEALAAGRAALLMGPLPPEQHEVIITLFIDIIAAGEARAARDALEGIPSPDQMAPVIVALDLMLGEPTNPPREVEAVARDIIARVEQLRAAIAAEAMAAKAMATEAMPAS